MRHSIITALAVCLAASFTACGNKQTKDAKAVDSTAIKDSIVSEKVEPQVDSTKIFSDATWSGEWEANGYDITIYTNDLVLRGTVSKDYKTLELSSESISKVSWTGSRKLKLQ